MTPGPKEYAKRGIRYAEMVVDGEIPAGKFARLACQRQLEDLEKFKDGKIWRWEPKRGERICKLAEKMPHIKGRWDSSTIVLQDWQCFILTTIFGWVDGTIPPDTAEEKRPQIRRFRKALIVIPRKNGKSIIAAVVALYMLAFDGEPGAEVYSAATSRDQAKISWDMARRMCLRLPELCAETGIEPLAHTIAIEATASKYEPLSRDADSLEGKNTHGAVIDELHAHKTREVFDVIDDSTGSRRQPLLFVISTEGDDSEGVFAEQVSYLETVLIKAHEDDQYFGIHYSLDKEDDWTLESSWKKANPNYAVSVFPHDMSSRCKQAQANSASQASFLTKRCNVRVGASESFFNMLAWTQRCKIENMDPEDLLGQPCVMAIDMASKSDLTSKVLLFRAKESYGAVKAGHMYVFTTNYLPDAATQPGKPNYDIYRGWMRANQITVTEGNITDYEHLERDLLADVKRFKPTAVGIDPNYNAAQFTTRMQQLGIQMADVAHNVQNFTNAMKDLDADIVAGRIHHNGDPVLTWAIGNVQAKTNAKGDVYPMKSREANKIDPAVALIAAKSLQLRLVTRQSVYSTGTGLI